MGQKSVHVSLDVPTSRQKTCESPSAGVVPKQQQQQQSLWSVWNDKLTIPNFFKEKKLTATNFSRGSSPTAALAGHLTTVAIESENRAGKSDSSSKSPPQNEISIAVSPVLA